MGFKKTSGIVKISSRVDESAPNTFTEAQVDLQLDVLNNEVFVVVACDINPSMPDALAGVDTATRVVVTATSQTTMQGLSDDTVIAISGVSIRAGGFADGGVGFQQQSLETPTGALDYIGIIATNNYFLGVLGTANATAKAGSARLWGYRAKADAATYAALVQSEVLSA